VPDNSGNKACGIFLHARKIQRAGCEMVKWANYEGKWFYIIFYFWLCDPTLQLTENQLDL